MSPRNNQASSGLLRLPQCSPRGRVGFKPTVDFGWRHSPSVLRDVVCVHSRTRLRLPPLGTALTVLAQEHTDCVGVKVEGTLKFALVVWLKMWCCLILQYGEERVLSCGRMRRTDSTSTLTSSLSCFHCLPLLLVSSRVHLSGPFKLDIVFRSSGLGTTGRRSVVCGRAIIDEEFAQRAAALERLF